MNNIIELGQLLAQKQFTVPEDIKVTSEGYIGKVSINLEVKPGIESGGTLIDRENLQENTKSMSEKKMQISDFHVVKKLRSGNFGQVYACYNKKT